MGIGIEMATMMATMKGWPPGCSTGARRVIAVEMATAMKGMATRMR